MIPLHTVKAVLRGRFIELQAYLKKQEKSQINNLTLHLKQLEKEETKNPRVSRRKEILKIRAEINAKETKETIVKINKAKRWFFEKINKIDKPYIKRNSKWIKDLNVKSDTKKHLEENIVKSLSDINHSRILSDPPPRILEIKLKINKWDLMKLKSFCTTKETISKVRRQPSQQEKIIANEATDNGLISKIYKQLLQLNSRKINGPVKKWAKELIRHFSKEDIQMANT